MMSIGRTKLVDVSVSRWYHCNSRSVHRERLLEEESEEGTDRKAWIEPAVVVRKDFVY